jgi:hypothetical protein
MFGPANLDEALETLGATLESRGITIGVLVAGGSSLLLLGLIDRPTADLDVVGIVDHSVYTKADPLPQGLAEAVRDVGRALGLSETWMNNGPASLMDLGLPAGLESRVAVRQYGTLEVHIPSRKDQIAFKLYAAVDQGPRSKHFADLVQLEPTPEELIEAARWTRTHDPSDGFRSQLDQALAALGVEQTDADS